jgi:hypothetical protein
MGVGLLRRHQMRLADANAEPGVVAGHFSHPAEDPAMVEKQMIMNAAEEEMAAEENKLDE